MRLINTLDLTLHEFPNEDGLEYAILSHRWEDGEVSYQELQSKCAAIEDKSGYHKIRDCCRQARKNGFEYAWIDTCCIDKTSSAELSEAINSMFRWYQASRLCYVFLSDVEANSSAGGVPDAFSDSLWFTRGWTLQELLAPQAVSFYDRHWQFLGTNDTLRAAISKVTGIDDAVLQGESIYDRSIAQRMSWASRRVTTRIEDAAYSLMGIFDVNMPMLYGEGHKAFVRLQEEIIRRSTDQTIFAWSFVGDKYSGLLARSPACFANSSNMNVREYEPDSPSSFAMTQSGLSMTLALTPWMADTYLAILACTDTERAAFSEHDTSNQVGVYLRKTSEKGQYVRVALGDKSYSRVDYSQLADSRRVDGAIKLVDISIRQPVRFMARNGFMDQFGGSHHTNHSVKDIILAKRLYGFRIWIQGKLADTDLLGVLECSTWDPATRIGVMREGEYGTAAIFDMGALDTGIRLIKFGFDFDFIPTLLIDSKRNSSSVYEKSSFTGPVWADGASNRALSAVDGTWSIRGDPNGISVRIFRVAMPKPVYAKSSPGEPQTLPFIHIQVRRGWYDDQLVWDVSIDGLNPVKKRQIGDFNFERKHWYSLGRTGDTTPRLPPKSEGASRTQTAPVKFL
ncbi:HET-domain-containing protein [Xylariaceae sp. FL0804]|nr:HET-domain-containing protein [Xylariaceae sp. FL0804]